ncbi:Bidirectional sugar transporter SWEET11 [Bienertia sinuspersici]
MTFAQFFENLPWITIFGLLGNVISFAVFLSPIPTFYRIYKKKSTEEFQSIPYVVALFSAMLWLLYAFVKTDVIFLVTINCFGFFVEIIYLTVFLIYANKKARLSSVKQLLLFNVFGFGVIFFCTMVIAKTTRVRLLILGWICLIFSLCVFVAPLGVMRKVIRTKSVEYMPFFLSFFLTISAIVWFFYGLLKHDYYVAVPNVLGFTFGIVQMILYFIYRNAKPNEKDIEVGKTKEASTESIIIEEPVKTQSKSNTTPSNNDDNEVFAIQIPNLNMLNLQQNNNNDQPMKISGLNHHTPPQISVAV